MKAFITVEGIEASGKSTLITALAAYAVNAGRSTTVTREPGGTPLGERVRAIFLDRSLAVDSLAEVFLLSAARAQHVAGVIEPALAQGKLVLCDRFVHATLAYQGYGRGLDLKLLRDLSGVATAGREPDATLLIDLPVEVSKARVLSRSSTQRVAVDRLEAERDEFHARVRAGYLSLARADARICVLDGTLAPDELLAAACTALGWA